MDDMDDYGAPPGGGGGGYDDGGMGGGGMDDPMGGGGEISSLASCSTQVTYDVLKLQVVVELDQPKSP
jgi:hypothetical protein